MGIYLVVEIIIYFLGIYLLGYFYGLAQYVYGSTVASPMGKCLCTTLHRTRGDESYIYI